MRIITTALILILTSAYCRGQQQEDNLAKRVEIIKEMNDYQQKVRSNGHRPTKAEQISEYKFLYKKYKELYDVCDDDPEAQATYLKAMETCQEMIKILER